MAEKNSIPENVKTKTLVVEKRALKNKYLIT